MKLGIQAIRRAVQLRRPFSFICCKVTVVGKEYFDACKW